MVFSLCLSSFAKSCIWTNYNDHSQNIQNIIWKTNKINQLTFHCDSETGLSDVSSDETRRALLQKQATESHMLPLSRTAGNKALRVDQALTLQCWVPPSPLEPPTQTMFSLSAVRCTQAPPNDICYVEPHAVQLRLWHHHRLGYFCHKIQIIWGGWSRRQALQD